MTSSHKNPWGKSDHELIEEIYYDVKDIRERMSSFVTWKALGTVGVTLATLVIAFLNLAT